MMRKLSWVEITTNPKAILLNPTVIVTTNPTYTTCVLSFWSVLTVYAYEDNQWEETLELIDKPLNMC